MDANKFERLQDIEYKIYPTCGNCKYGAFANGRAFGVCSLFDYQHQKHSDSKRSLSVVSFGGCSSYEEPQIIDEQYVDLHGFTDFRVSARVD